jgi:hypothetical protein
MRSGGMTWASFVSSKGSMAGDTQLRASRNAFALLSSSALGFGADGEDK